MKLTAGLGNAEDYRAYMEAGADEVFTGYIPLSWQKTHQLSSPLNRREVVCCGAQIGLKNELERLVSEGAKPAITVNSLFYRADEYPLIADIIEDCIAMGIKSFIVADPALIYYLHLRGINQRIRLHVSGEFGEMNRFTLEELKRLGARRIIFSRKVTLPEMEALTDGSLEYEAFCMNERCHFNGAHCLSLHADGLPPLCREPYRIDAPQTPAAPGIDGCALCALPRLQKAGITHLKIVGRGAATEEMLETIKLTKAALNLLEASASETEYLKLLPEIIPDDACGHRCYYY